MKIKKFSEKWFKNKKKQFEKMNVGHGKKLTSTKGWKPDTRSQNTKDQRLYCLKKLAKEKGVKYE